MVNMKLKHKIIIGLVVCGCFLGGFRYGVVTTAEGIGATRDMVKTAVFVEAEDPVMQKAILVTRATITMRDAGDISSYYELSWVLDEFAKKQLSRLKGIEFEKW